MKADAKAYVKACDKCQRYSNIPRQSSEYLIPIVAPWPFAQWGLDILGPYLMGMRQMKFLVVRIDYFTKLVEAEPLAKALSGMSRALSRKTLYVASKFLGCSSQTMDANLTKHPSESFTSIWGLGNITPYPPTHRLMDKLKLPINPSWRSSRPGLRVQEGYGRMNYPMSFGCIGRK